MSAVGDWSSPWWTPTFVWMRQSPGSGPSASRSSSLMSSALVVDLLGDTLACEPSPFVLLMPRRISVLSGCSISLQIGSYAWMSSRSSQRSLESLSALRRAR